MDYQKIRKLLNEDTTNLFYFFKDKKVIGDIDIKKVNTDDGLRLLFNLKIKASGLWDDDLVLEVGSFEVVSDGSLKNPTGSFDSAEVMEKMTKFFTENGFDTGFKK
jgi:hypothetical protein